MKTSLVDASYKNAWNSFLENQSHSSFLQSWEMGSFYENRGEKVWRLALLEGEELKGVCLVVKTVARFSTYLYLPGGPVGHWEENFDDLVTNLKKIGQEEKSSFIRFEPRSTLNLAKLKNFVKAPLFTQPACSLLLDLEQSIEEIRKNLSDSTRYNLGWVERKGVRVAISSREKEIEHFNNLLEQTALRQGFTLNKDKDYYEKQFLAFLEGKKAKLFISRAPQELGGEVLAAAIVIYFGDSVTYLHAASSSSQPKLRAPYLMQWKIIEDAKKEGFKWYDFWGVAKDDSKKDSWSGVTAFKTSFGGKRVFYQKPLDIPLKISYPLVRQLEKWRKPLKILFRK